jgi:hypothetical protein
MEETPIQPAPGPGFSPLHARYGKRRVAPRKFPVTGGGILQGVEAAPCSDSYTFEVPGARGIGPYSYSAGID